MTPERQQQLYILILAFALILLFQSMLERAPAPKNVAYSEFLTMVSAGEIEEVEIRSDELRAKKKSSDRVIAQRIPGTDGEDLTALLQKNGIKFSGYLGRKPWWQTLLFAWVLPMGFLFILYSMVTKRMSKGGPLSFAKSNAKIYDRSKENRVTFNDVAGVDEAKEELREVVDFLKNPKKYLSIGAHIPRGVLLVGPPGSGKTLLARAVAGEAEVPFYSMSGSEFVEMFVGVGAARMRSLFEQAKTRAPCIVFLDELDAIGRSRGGLGAMATNDEREQTLNQLLVEMDGFANNTGVIVMAATNRPEVLDPALVRAGRFDRQVLVDNPDIRGREAILKIHCRKLALEDEVILKTIARRTPGMSGADLANVANEAALSAARRSSSRVGVADFEDAIDRIQLGLRKTSQIMSPAERTRVAYHEGGHSLVAMSLKHADPVHKVTIVPRGVGALGATLQLPTQDRYLLSRDELVDRLCVLLAGRAAEELVCKSVSTGAANDLERATETARQMVCRFGMSELGTQTFGVPSGLQFLNSPFGSATERNYSEETAKRIDAAVGKIMETERQRAYGILKARRSTLELLAQRLLQDETLDAEELHKLTSLATDSGASEADRPGGDGQGERPDVVV